MIKKIKEYFSQIIWNLLVNCIGKSYLISPKLRYYIYKMPGMRIYTNKVRSGCIFRGKSIFIEKDVLINHNVFIDGWQKVIIKQGTSIACGTAIITSTHKIGDYKKRVGESIRKQVIIGEGCWIGAKVVILPGVNIGQGCVIAAGSVVIKDCKANTMYAGVPAKEIKNLY